MHKKRLPILQKVSNILKVPIFIAKMRMHVVDYLVKSRRIKKFKFLMHYNYGNFIGEYEFTPSSTPLIYCPPNREFKKRSFRELSSMLFSCRCLGDFTAENYDYEDFLLGPVLAAPDVEEFSALDVDEEDSVDQRAERFIEWFYEDLRMQGRQSL